jgi:FixJ family two-component response regulator
MNKTVKVLIVEDESTVQSILAAFFQRYLGERGMTGDIRTLTDPVQGLFDLSTNGEQYGAILLDVRLPKLTGDEIYNSLEQVNPNLLKRILFVTGYPGDLTERWPGRKLNILEKPFRYQAFEEQIGGILV